MALGRVRSGVAHALEAYTIHAVATNKIQPPAGFFRTGIMARAVVHFSVPLARAGSRAAVAAALAGSGLLFDGGGCVIGWLASLVVKAKPWATGC